MDLLQFLLIYRHFNFLSVDKELISTHLCIWFVAVWRDGFVFQYMMQYNIAWSIYKELIITYRCIWFVVVCRDGFVFQYMMQYNIAWSTYLLLLRKLHLMNTYLKDVSWIYNYIIIFICYLYFFNFLIFSIPHPWCITSQYSRESKVGKGKNVIGLFGWFGPPWVVPLNKCCCSFVHAIFLNFCHLKLCTE